MKLDEINYLEYDSAISIHNHIIENSGGAFGLRDEGLLIATLQRPKNLAHYNPESDIFELAAVLVTGIALNHPFFDGNKRSALSFGLMFLRKNGIDLRKLGIAETRALMVNVATRRASDTDVANFFRNLALDSKLDASLCSPRKDN
jgi:death-on-curing protein